MWLYQSVVPAAGSSPHSLHAQTFEYQLYVSMQNRGTESPQTVSAFVCVNTPLSSAVRRDSYTAYQDSHQDTMLPLHNALYIVPYLDAGSFSK